jgi:hypothetical protein
LPLYACDETIPPLLPAEKTIPIATAFLSKRYEAFSECANGEISMGDLQWLPHVLAVQAIVVPMRGPAAAVVKKTAKYKTPGLLLTGTPIKMA